MWLKIFFELFSLELNSVPWKEGKSSFEGIFIKRRLRFLIDSLEISGNLLSDIIILLEIRNLARLWYNIQVIFYLYFCEKIL